MPQSSGYKVFEEMNNKNNESDNCMKNEEGENGKMKED
jgi:hypothetical protein